MTELIKDSQVLILVILALSVVASLLIGYLIGHKVGYDANDQSGWEDEALWWRANAISITTYENRKVIE